jgi:AcrR family transcriptional regulator
VDGRWSGGGADLESRRADDPRRTPAVPAADGPARGSAGRAARRFVAVGIRKTTMEDIAKEARAGKATLYRHFANKDAVIDALLEREAARLDRRLRTAAAERPTPPVASRPRSSSGCGSSSSTRS